MAGWDMVGEGPGAGGGDMSWINDGFGCRRKRLKEHLSMAAGEDKPSRGGGRGRGRGKSRGDDGPSGAGRGLGHLLGNIGDDPGLDFQRDIDRDFHRDRDPDRDFYHDRDIGRERPPPHFHREDPYREGPPDRYREGPPDPYREGPPDPYREGPPDPYREGPPDRYREGPPDPYREGPPRDRFREPPPDRDRERDRERRGRHDKMRRDERPESPPAVSMAWPTTNEFEERPEPPRKGRYARDEEYEEERQEKGERDRERDKDRKRDRDRDRGRGKLSKERERSPRDKKRPRSPERAKRKRDEKDEEPTGRKLEPWETLVPETWEDKKQEFFCKLCNVQTSSLKNLEGHCQGKMHRMRAELFPDEDPMKETLRKIELERREEEERGRVHREGERKPPREPAPEEEEWYEEEEYWEEELSLEDRMKLFFCSLCEVQTTSDENYQMHLKGMRHKANEERKKRGDDVIKGSRNKGNKKKKKITTDGLEVVEITSIMEKCTEPIVGLENIVEYFRQEWQTESNFYCQMCETKFQQVNFIPHVTGYRHRYAYIKIKRPEMKDHCRVEPKGKETTIKVDGEIFVEKTPKRNRTDVLNTLRKVCREILKQEGQQKMQKGVDPDPPEMPINRLKKTMRADSQVQLKVLDPEEFKKPVTVPAPIPLGGGVKRPAPKQQPKERKEKEDEPKPPGPRPTIIGYQPPDVPPPGMLVVPSDLPPDAPPPTSMMMKPGARPLFPAGVNPGMPPGPHPGMMPMMPGMPMMPTMGAPMIPMAGPGGQFMARPMPLPMPPRPPPPRPEDLVPTIPATFKAHKHKALIELEAEIEKEEKQELEKEMQRRARDPYLDRLSNKPVNVSRLREKDRTQIRAEDPFLASYIERGRPPVDREVSPPPRERMKEYRAVFERDARLSPGRERRLSREGERRRSPDRERRRSPGRDRGRRRRDSPPRDRGRSPRRDPLLDRPEMSQKLKDLYSREQLASSSSSRSKHRADKGISGLSDEDLKRAFEERFGEKKSTSSNAIEEVVSEISKSLVQTGEDASMALRVSTALTKALLSIDKKQKTKPPPEPAKDEPPPPIPGYYDPSMPTDMDMDIANSPEPSPQRQLVEPGGAQFGPNGTFGPQPGGSHPYGAFQQYGAPQPAGPPMGMPYGQMVPMQMGPVQPNAMYMQQGQPMYPAQFAAQPYNGPQLYNNPYEQQMPGPGGPAPGPAPQAPAPGPPGGVMVEDMTGGEYSF